MLAKPAAALGAGMEVDLSSYCVDNGVGHRVVPRFTLILTSKVNMKVTYTTGATGSGDQRRSQ